MYIKSIVKRNKGYKKTFTYYRLMESYRTERGPRQRTLLNLGKLENIPTDMHKALADRIEDIVSGQTSLIAVSTDLDEVAQHFASLLVRHSFEKEKIEEQQQTPEYATIDIKSVKLSETRKIGAEYVGVSMFRKLGMDKILRENGFTEKQINLTALLIVGRLAYPSSEKGTREWAREISGIGELLGTQFKRLSNNILYRTLDLIYEHKQGIEDALRHNEKEIFELKEKIILYDLTNTYFEGESAGNEKAGFGRSKEKRTDCPLITLGLVIDEDGFPKASRIFKGNVAEPKTLLEMIKALEYSENAKPTVIIDAGIATKANLQLLTNKGYKYIAVARNKPLAKTELDGKFKTLSNGIEVKMIKKDDETILYCKSEAKKKKEQQIKSFFQQRYEDGLNKIALALKKKGGIKKYEKVLERLGRLTERNAGVAQFYEVEVKESRGQAVSIEWKMTKPDEAEQRYSGTYFLRTTRTDLSPEQIRALYVMLTNIEDAFRTLKSELNLRPIWHQKTERVEAHTFVAVLAYHLLNSIQYMLRKQDIHTRWSRIREFLSTHMVATTSFKTQDGRKIYIRHCSSPDPFPRIVYKALHLNFNPFASKTTKL